MESERARLRPVVLRLMFKRLELYSQAVRGPKKFAITSFSQGSKASTARLQSGVTEQTVILVPLCAMEIVREEDLSEKDARRFVKAFLAARPEDRSSDEDAGFQKHARITLQNLTSALKR